MNNIAHAKTEINKRVLRFATPNPSNNKLSLRQYVMKQNTQNRN